MWKRTALALTMVTAFAARANGTGLVPAFELRADEGSVAIKRTWVTVFHYGQRQNAKSYRYDGRTWVRGSNQPLSVARQAVCDHGDEARDATDTEATAALPAGSKIKKVLRFATGQALVVYSRPPTRAEGSGFMALRLAHLVGRPDGGLKLMKAIGIGMDGDFCDLYLLEGDTALVLSREAMGSEYGIGAYAFQIEK